MECLMVIIVKTNHLARSAIKLYRLFQVYGKHGYVFVQDIFRNFHIADSGHFAPGNVVIAYPL